MSKFGAAGALGLRFFSNRYLLGLSLAIIFLAGISALNNMPRIEDPRITNRYPQIVTALPGASAERVEALVSDPIEDSLRELSEIKKLRSTSRSGISIISIELQDYIGPGDNQQVFAKLRDRLNDVVPSLPVGATAPEFNDKNSAIAFSMIVSITSDQDTTASLSVMNRLSDTLADRFRDNRGTDNVRIFGAPDEEISVSINAAELSSIGLTASDVAASISRADTKLPAGAMRSNSSNLFIEVDGELDTLQRVRQIPVVAGASGQIVSVGDIANVRKKWQDPPADVTYSDGKRSVLVAVQTRRDIRVDQWAADARAIVQEFAAESGSGIGVDIVFDQSIYTEDRLTTLGGNLLAGAGLVALIVFVGMGWRAALIVGTALPLSASLTVFGLSIAGQQIHQMSIFGMIIAIGLLIDNAIVMTDEVKKHLDIGDERADAVRSALAHLFVPLLASTLTTILAFMPIFLLPGAMGDFVGPIATSVVLALTASFFVAVSIIPALAGLFLARDDKTKDGPHSPQRWWKSGFSSRRLSAAYRRLLHTAITHSRTTIVLALALPALGFFLASTLGQQFFPPADRDQFEIEVWLNNDASIEHTSQITSEIEQMLRTYNDVEQVHWRIGGTFPTIYYNRVMKVSGNNAYAHAMVYTTNVDSARTLTTDLPRIMSDAFPEAQIVVSPFAQGPPSDAPVGFEIEGPSTEVLKHLGDRLRAIMHELPQIVQTRASISGGQPKLNFVANEVAASQAGLSLTQIAAQMQTSLEGQIGGSLLEDLEELPVRVRIEGADRDSTSSIESLVFVSNARPGSQTDRWIPSSGIGEIEYVPEAGSITRRDGIRSNTVLGYITRDSLAIDVTNEILEKVGEQNFNMPSGYVLRVAGSSADQREALGNLFTYLPILLSLMVATIVLSFRSLRLAALIGTVAVLSVGLGMLSLWAGGYSLGFNAIIGSVGLIGVAINGTIVVLAAIRASEQASAGNVDSIVNETMGATRHIVSTTLTTVGGFIPLLLFNGGEFWPPLAVVISGGVAFSITLSLLFTPAVYRWLHCKKVARAPISPSQLPDQSSSKEALA